MAIPRHEQHERRPSLDDEVNAALAKRAPTGVAAYILLLCILVYVAPSAHGHAVIATTALVWMALVSAARLWVAREFLTLYPVNPARWSSLFAKTTLAAGVSWGLGCAAWTHATGWGADSLVVLVTTAGISSGATSSLGPSQRLVRAYLALMLVPTIATKALFGDGSTLEHGFVLLMLIHLAFLLREGKRQADSFALAIHKNHLLEAHAAELAERARNMRLVLETVEEGFLNVGLDGTMALDRSAILTRWLGPSQPEEKLWEYIGRVDPQAGNWLALGWPALVDGALPLEVVVGQLPRTLIVGAQAIELDYRPRWEDGALAGVVVTLSDATSQIERERSEESRRELSTIFDHVVHDRPGFMQFLAESSELVRLILTRTDAKQEETRRWVHTLKGNSALFGLERVSRACHELESRLVETRAPILPAQREELAAVWRATTDKVTGLLERKEQGIHISPADYEAVANAIADSVPRIKVTQMIEAWKLEPTLVRLQRIAGQARAMGERMGKGSISVVVEPNGLRLPPEKYGAFWSVASHLVRNALDHGLETPEERVLAGKPAAGMLVLKTHLDPGELVISVEDDGRGIDWARVEAHAKQKRLPHATRKDLEAVLVADGVSTKERVTEVSGRGLGLGAVLAVVRELGGRLVLSSQPSRGTRWEARFPYGAPPSRPARRPWAPLVSRATPAQAGAH